MDGQITKARSKIEKKHKNDVVNFSTYNINFPPYISAIGKPLKGVVV